MENSSAPQWEKVLSIGCVLENREESSSIVVEMKAELMRWRVKILEWHQGIQVQIHSKLWKLNGQLWANLSHMVAVMRTSRVGG